MFFNPCFISDILGTVMEGTVFIAVFFGPANSTIVLDFPPQGLDFYILIRGKVEILVNNNVVFEMDAKKPEKGACFGEKALIAKEKVSIRFSSSPAVRG